MKKFNIVLILFLVAQSTNTYSMNAVRRAASRTVNRLAPKAKTLAEDLLEKSKNTLENNIKQAKRFYNTAENTLLKKADNAQSIPKQNQHSTAKRNFAIKPIINSKEKTNIKNIGLAGALAASGAYLLLDKNSVSCFPNFNTLPFELLCDYLQKHPNSLEKIFPYLQTWDYKIFIEIFPQYQEQLFQLVSDNFAEYENSNIDYLVQAFPNYQDQLFELVSINFTKYKSIIDIKNLAKVFPDYQDKLLQLVADNFSQFSLENIFRLIETFFSKRHIIEEKLLSALDKDSEEYLHIKKCLLNLEESSYAPCISFLYKYSTSRQFKQALTKKTELESQEYVSFFHGQQSQFGFLEDFTKELFNSFISYNLISSEQLRDDFLFIQNSKKLFTNNSEIPKNETDEQINLMKGRRLWSELRRRSTRLSVNMFLSGNITRSGCCSWLYVENNANDENGYNHDLDLLTHILNPFNIPQELYSKYKNRFDQLIKKHKALFKKGRLLLIAIPKEKVDQYAYLASDGAFTNAVHRTTKLLIFRFHVKKISELLNRIKQNPDQFSFDALDRGSEAAIPLTQAYALNPYSDIKIFAFDAEPTDQAEYEQYLKERKQLAEDIAKDVAEINKQTHEFDGLEVCCKEITEAAKTAQSFY